MRMVRRWSFRLVVAGTLVLVLLGHRNAIAGVPSDQLRDAINQVLRVLDDPDLRKETKARERRLAIRTIANGVFDFEEMTKRALARHWQARTPEERQEIIGLFGDLLERAYISKIELYRGETVRYGGESVEDDQTTVRTKILTKQGTEVPVDYRMHRRDDRWLIYDVLIEGISLVANYRAQFDKIIQTSSYRALVTRLKTLSPQAGDTGKGTGLDGRAR